MANAENTQPIILKRMLDDMPEYYDKSVGTFIWDILSAVSYEFENEYNQVFSEFESNLITRATGTDLDELLEPFGFFRKGATKAAGTVIFTGKPGAEISYNDLVASNACTYSVTENGTIGDDGTARVKIECTVTGNIGNSAIDTVNIIPIGLCDIYSVNNDTAITGGSSVESDEDFRARFIDYYSNVSASGNKADYENWAKEVDGIGFAECIPVWNGGGTVKVIVADTNNKPVTPELLTSVYNHISEKDPVCAELTVANVSAIEVTLKIALTIDASFNVEKINQDIAGAADEYFSTLKLDGDTINYFVLVKYIMQVNGIMGCEDLAFVIGEQEYRKNYIMPPYSVAVVSEIEELGE